MIYSWRIRLCGSTEKTSKYNLLFTGIQTELDGGFMEKGKFFSAKRITGLAVLLALVIVLQVFGGYFKIGATSLSFVLVPIVLAGLLYGPIEAGILGFAFGIIVIIQGAMGVDGFTLILLQDHPVWTVLLCIVKGTMAGVVAGLLFKALKKKNVYVAIFVASAAAPIVNTGLFILGSLAFLQDTLKANFVGGQTVVYFLVVVCAGVNFLVELAINLIVAPGLHTVYKVVEKSIKK